MDAQKFGAFVAERRKEKKYDAGRFGRKKVFSILGISIAAVLLLLAIDSAGWEVSAIVFFVFGVILPLFGAVSGMILIGYGIWRKIHHIYSGQTFRAALICLLMAALPYVLAVILVMLGGFPVPN